ncbi:beta-lactamase family protein [Gammaproteobacteria bacterium]|nr:beta-lactamase family protein [Gammaproteobacteria bacterium]
MEYLDEHKIETLVTRVGREISEGLLPAAQIAIGYENQIVFSKNFGDTKPDSLFCIFSATKAITSAASWLLMQDEILSEDDLVTDYIPEFGKNGKSKITLSHLLTHTAGFPHAPFRPVEWRSKEARLSRFKQWRIFWEPGTQFEYHPSSSMYVVAEIIERASGTDFGDFVQTRIFDPLRLSNSFIGLPDDQGARALEIKYCGEELSEQEYKEMGFPIPPKTEVTEDAVLSFNERDVRASGIPGGGAFSNAKDMAMFYQALLHGGTDQKRLWQEDILLSAKTIRNPELRDPVFKKAANRGLGIVISGDTDRNYRGFGKTNSPLAFGHNGAGGQLCWADPDTGLSFVYLTSGHDRNPIRQGRRGVSISSLAAECKSRKC